MTTSPRPRTAGRAAAAARADHREGVDDAKTSHQHGSRFDSRSPLTAQQATDASLTS